MANHYPLLVGALMFCLQAYSQPSAISINISQPTEGFIVDTTLMIQVNINSTYELQGVRASVGPVQTNLAFQGGSWTNTLDLTSATGITNTLTVTAQDIFGFISQTQRTIILDHPPVLTVLAPLNYTVARSSLVYVEATASDGESQNCTISVYDGPYVPPIQRRLLGTNVVTGFVTTFGTLLFEARDQRGQFKRIVRQIVIEPNSNLVEVASAPGKILDFSDTRFLYTFNPDPGRFNGGFASLSKPEVAILERNSGAIVVAPDNANRAAVLGYLTHAGAFLGLEFYSQYGGSLTPNIAAWTGLTLSNFGDCWTLSRLSFANQAAAWDWINPTRIVVQDVNSTANQFSITNNSPRYDLAANSDLVYSTGYSGGGIFRSRPLDPAAPFGARVTTQLITNGVSPKTDGTNVVYQKGPETTLWTPAGEETLTTTNGDYLINNGWVAFTRPGSAGQAQIWTRSPSGLVEQRTFYGSSSGLESLGPKGALTFTNNSLTPTGRYISRPGSPPWNVGQAQGLVRWSGDGSPLILLGRSVFAVHAGQLQVLSHSNGAVRLAFAGPAGQNLQLQTSSNLLNWTNTATFSNGLGTAYVTNLAAGTHQFFRTVVLP